MTPAAAPTADLMTLSEVGVYLHRTDSQMRWLIHTGKAPRHGKIGGRIAFRRRDVDAWLDERFSRIS